MVISKVEGDNGVGLKLSCAALFVHCNMKRSLGLGRQGGKRFLLRRSKLGGAS